MNPYKVLGVGADASKSEIKKAYRVQSKNCHPDTGGNEAIFHELHLAYRVLSDDTKRRVYDGQGVILDESPNHIKNQVLSKLTGLFENWLDTVLSGKDIPFGVYMKSQLAKGRKEIKEANCQINQTIQELETVQNRLSHKKDRHASLFHKILQTRIQGYKQAQHQNEQEEVCMEQVEKILSEYEYQEPEKQEEEFYNIFRRFSDTDEHPMYGRHRKF